VPNGVSGNFLGLEKGETKVMHKCCRIGQRIDIPRLNTDIVSQSQSFYFSVFHVWLEKRRACLPNLLWLNGMTLEESNRTEGAVVDGCRSLMVWGAMRRGRVSTRNISVGQIERIVK
jgi:hypothetical protein